MAWIQAQKLLGTAEMLTWPATSALCDISPVCLKLHLCLHTKLRSQGMEPGCVCRYFERQKWVVGEMHEEHRM